MVWPTLVIYVNLAENSLNITLRKRLHISPMINVYWMVTLTELTGLRTFFIFLNNRGYPNQLELYLS